jgi:CRISPR system Cascade subunit CasC
MKPDTLFLQIHALTPFAAALLNRDDVGRAKRLPYGGKTRIRVSSQCLKRHWRDVASDWSLASFDDPVTGAETPTTVRSRKIFSREVAKPLVEVDGFAAADVITVLDTLASVLLGESKKAKSEKAAAKKRTAADAAPAETALMLDEQLRVLDTNQVIVLGRPEIEFIRATAAELLRQRPSNVEAAVKSYLKQRQTTANLAALRLAAGIDAALFGRMVTSDIFARGDAALHVAHALTVHAEETEPDYFVAIDDLTREAGELGTGLIQTTELTSGVFYAYVVIDVPKLVSNLEGVAETDWRRADLRLATKVVERLIHVVATTSPGAKLGSTAPYGYADLLMVESGRRQPRSLMTAFHSAVCRQEARTKAVAALGMHLTRFDTMYGAEEQRRLASLLDASAIPVEAETGLAGLARWTASRLTEAAGSA